MDVPRDEGGAPGATLAKRATAGAVALVAAACAAACQEAPRFTARRTFTSTVAIARETALELRTVIPVTASGVPRLDELHVRVDATITASTSTRANALARALALTVDRADGRLGLLLDHPPEAALGGTLALEAPADLALQIVDYGGAVEVRGFGGDLAVGTTAGARIVGAARDATVEVGAGYALVDSLATPGSTTRVKVGSGSIELSLPEGLSADVRAATGSGQISIAHPRLPAYVGGTGLPYTANVGGGLAVVRLETGAGNIVIRTR